MQKTHKEQTVRNKKIVDHNNNGNQSKNEPTFNWLRARDADIKVIEPGDQPDVAVSKINRK